MYILFTVLSFFYLIWALPEINVIGLDWISIYVFDMLCMCWFTCLWLSYPERMASSYQIWYNDNSLAGTGCV